MKRHKSVALGFILLLMTTCNVVSHRDFSAYKVSPMVKGSASFKMNGIYFVYPYRHMMSNPPVFLYFYFDGTVILDGRSGHSNLDEGAFWERPDAYIRGFRSQKFSGVGHYFVREREIVIQYFEIDPGSFYSQKPLELRGIVRDDSTLQIDRGVCSWCYQSWLRYKPDGQVAFDNLVYRFHASEFKPDSAEVWFKRKAWYNRHRWREK